MPGEQSIHFTAARFHARCSPERQPIVQHRSYTGAMSLKSALRSPAADELCSKGFPATSSSLAIARARRDARCGVEKGRRLSAGGDENRPRGARDARDGARARGRARRDRRARRAGATVERHDARWRRRGGVCGAPGDSRARSVASDDDRRVTSASYSCAMSAVRSNLCCVVFCST